MGIIIPMERIRKRMEKKEYIEREAVMQKFADHVRRSNNSDFAPVPTWNQAVQIVEDFPAADVRPVVRGKWIDDKELFYLGCSECGCFLEYAVDTFLDEGDHYNYCPNCGADMMET